MSSRFRPKDYHCPRSPDEAVSLKFSYGRKASFLAGGTDLLVQKPPSVECLIDLRLLTLNYPGTVSNTGCRIGALTPIQALVEGGLFAQNPYAAIHDAAAALATPTIRNRATIGGNLCNASPASDLSLAMMVTKASLIALGREGERRLPIGQFFLAPHQTILNSHELLKEVLIDPLPDQSATSFVKLRRHQTSVDLAIASVASFLHLEQERCEEAIIAMGAVGPTPLRAHKAEAALRGEVLNDALLTRASELAAEESSPISDIRASGEYRRKILPVIVRRSLEISLARCR